MGRWVAGLCLFLGACGGGTRASEAPAAREKGTRAAPLAAPSGELATSELPVDSVFWLRVRSMARDLPALARFDVATDEVKTVLENPRFLVETFVGDAIARVVDLDAPVDVLLSARGPMDATFALRPNQDFEKSSGLARRELEPGRFLLEPAERSDEEAKHCELWQSATAGDRILCGPSGQRVTGSAPFFFGRAARLSSGGAAFRVEVSGHAIWGSVLEEVERDQRELGGAPHERAGAELGMRWAKSLFGGNRAIVGELDLVGSEAELALELVFDGEAQTSALKSWFGTGRPRALSDAFSKLPADSELTFGFAGADPGSATSVLREWLREFSAAGTTAFDASERDRRDVEEVTFEALPSDGRFVLALGHEREAIRELSARVEAAESSGRASSPKDVTNLAAALSGWALVGIEVDPLAYVKNLRRLVEVYARPFAKAKSGGAGGTNAAGQPEGSHRPLQSHLEVAAKLPANLPKGSLHVVAALRPNPAYQPPPGDAKPVPLPHDEHYVVVPDGPRVWIAIARDEAVAARRARAQLGSKKGAGAPSSKGSGSRTVGAGFFSLNGLVAISLDGDTPEARAASGIALAELAALPNRGRNKIPTELVVFPHDDGTVWSVALRGRVALPAIQDIVAWLSQSDSVVGVLQ